MVISLFERMTLFEQLQTVINLDQFVPKVADVPEISQNIIDCYESELEESMRSYFTVKGDTIKDIIEFVRASGGYELFDFVV